MLKGYTREEKSWMMYDWANSAHSVIIVTLLPIFYSSVAKATANATSAMQTWGYVTSGAMFIIAALSPILGALGDFAGYRKKLFIAFMIMGVLPCVGLAFTPLSGFEKVAAIAEKVGPVILILYVISQLGYSYANLYYDSFLPDVTTNERMDKVSTMGYGLGYIGGSTVPLLLFLILNLVGVDMLYCLSFAFGFTAIWWCCFTWPLIKNVEQKSSIPPQKGALLVALKGLSGTMRDIFRHKSIFVFLIAYFFYIDGVGTIIHMSTIYGDTLGLNATSMMLAMLLVQLLGLPFCLLYIKLADKFGARKMVGVGILIYMCTCVFGFFVRSEWQFWMLAVMVSTSQGGIQALSRSMFGKMIPDKNRTGEYFGFYDIFGKFSTIMGPLVCSWAMGVATNAIMKTENIASNASPEVFADIAARSAPWGVLSILLIFFVGAALYFFVLPRCLKEENVDKI
ncbi:MAG: MFS transporter [Oscillospiraceae bacterium]